MRDVREQIRDTRPAADDVTPLDMTRIVGRARRTTVLTRATSVMACALLLAGGALFVNQFRPVTSLDVEPLMPELDQPKLILTDPTPEPQDVPTAPDPAPEPEESAAPSPPSAAPSPPPGTPAPTAQPEPETSEEPPQLYRPMVIRVHDLTNTYPAHDFAIWVEGRGTCRAFPQFHPDETPCDDTFGEFPVGQIIRDALILYPDGPDGVDIPITFIVREEPPSSGPQWGILMVLVEDATVEVGNRGGFVDISDGSYDIHYERSTGQIRPGYENYLLR